MYELDDDKICNDKYWVTLTENTHIKSSGEAAKILKQLESDGVLPKMQNHEWARLCIAFCFAKTKNIKDWEQKPSMDGGLEIASFNTCFNQNGKKGEEKFWLAYISQRMFDEVPERKFTKKHLFAYIQLAWHNGAKLLEERYRKALDYCDSSIVEAKKYSLTNWPAWRRNTETVVRTVLHRPFQAACTRPLPLWKNKPASNSKPHWTKQSARAARYNQNTAAYATTACACSSTAMWIWKNTTARFAPN